MKLMDKLNLKSLEPRIAMLPETKLVAKVVSMSFANDRTFELWQEFGSMIKSIQNRVDDIKYSVQIFPDVKFFQHFNLTRNFKKCAAVGIDSYSDLPNSLEKLTIPEGQYAVFDYIGKPSEAVETFRYILYEWIPSSEYNLDNRPHFAKMDEKYKGEYVDSEEELWIPITKK